MKRRALAVAALVSSALIGCRERNAEPDPGRGARAAGGVPSSVSLLPTRVVSRSYAAMGTAVEFKVWTDREVAARAAMEDALREIQRIEAMVATRTSSSEVSKINANAGRAPTAASPELIEVLHAAQALHDASFSVFDIARLLVDGSRVEIDDRAHTVRLPKIGMAIDLGGIAKGYAIDKAAAVLANHGFTDAVVQAGSNLMVRGRKGQGAWRVGIRDPRGAADDSFAIAPVHDAAFSTAGDYHHILDPRTGRPATACRSVTILAPDALTADALDDAVFILGPEKGLPLVETRPGVGAVIVDRDNHVVVSKRLQGVVEILHPPTPGP